MKSVDAKTKILITPLEIAGMFGNLQKGLLDLGVQATFVQRTAHPFRYRPEIFVPKIVVISRKFLQKNSANIIARYSYIALSHLCWNMWGAIAIFKFDAFIFTYGHSLLARNIDLPILKMLRKTVIMNMQCGSESRPPYMDGGFAHLNAMSRKDAIKLARIARETELRVRRAEKFSTFLVGSPMSTSQFATQPFINSLYFGLPQGSKTELLAKSNQAEALSDRRASLTVVHSPSNESIKGTKIIATAIEKLQAKNVKIDFKKITGVTNDVVKNELGRCDFVVDQMYSDTPMATLGAEAAIQKKPTVISGYPFEKPNKYFSKELLGTAKTCVPEELDNTLRNFIDSPEMRDEVSKNAQNFVLKNWESSEVARKYLRLLSNDFPEEWWILPDESIYIFGCGQSKSKTFQQISGMISHLGLKSLRLNRKPKVLSEVMEFLNQSRDHVIQ